MCCRLFLSLILTAGIPLECSTLTKSLDLNRLLNDPNALTSLVIRYQASQTEVLYVYGSGKVVKQTVLPQLSDALVPTCTGRISNEQVRDLVQFMSEHRFFGLPLNSYYYATASDDEDDYWNAVKVHSIVVDDGISRAHRDFAAGVWLGWQQTLPENFVAIENKLLGIQESATANKPCRLAPGIRLPAAQQPTVVPQELKWSLPPTNPAI
jgi:hypothetical protein